jgi:uroporphyrin-III C-methyltransferase/precorrin-2 dehydrogenase/sirohydrochlorin ferrochelatase
VLDLARRDATRICVGKAAGGDGAAQADIHAALIRHARAGRRVVRLKGGDPFVFGRGGEELEALAAAGVPFSVIPGVTAASGCAAYAGIPLTHRDHAHSVSFVTAHPDRTGIEPDWAALARARQTAVFYMGLARIEHIVSRLLAHGAPPERAAALVERGTSAEQRVLVATLGTLSQAAANAPMSSPALLIVGDVAALSTTLAWFHAAEEAKEISASA